MRCDCCGRRKRPFESFSEVNDNNNALYLCVTCNDLFYRLRDAATEDDKLEFDRVIADLEKRMKKSSVTLKDWAAKFIEKQEAKLSNPSDKGGLE